MPEILKLKDQPHYNIRYNSLFSRPLLKSVNKGTKSLPFLGTKNWDILQDTYKNMPDLNRFKVALKRWRPVNCPCRICQVSIANVIFV